MSDVIITSLCSCEFAADEDSQRQTKLDAELFLYYAILFHDLLSAPRFHQSVWSVITAHTLTPAKRDVTTVVNDQRSRFTAPSIGDYNTPDTVA